MNPHDSSLLSPNIQRDVLIDAVQTYWTANPDLRKSNLLNDSKCLTNIRALLPAPFNGLHVDEIRQQIDNLSKVGAMPKAVMTGQLTREEWDSKKSERQTLGRAFHHLDGERETSQEYRRLIASLQWQDFAAGMRRKRGYQCQLCHADFSSHGKDLDVHHWTYGDNLSRFFDEHAVWVVCHPHHSLIHFLADMQAGKIIEETGDCLFD